MVDGSGYMRVAYRLVGIDIVRCGIVRHKKRW